MLEVVWQNANLYSVLMCLQIDIATMEISVDNSQKDKNKSTMTPSYTIT